MSTLLRESEHVASKDYECSACNWIINIGDGFGMFSISERREIIKARRNNWKIKKGEKYYQQINIWCGDFNVFKAIPAINEICLTHDLYDEA